VRRFGLRPRLLAALVLTSAVTLAFAALALLTPLRDRLRTDATQTLVATLGAAHIGFAELDTDATGKVDQGELRQEALALQRRVSGRVTVFDQTLAPVYDTEPDTPAPTTLARRSLAANRPIHVLQGEQLQIAQPVRIGGQRYVVTAQRRLTYVQTATRVVQNVFIKAAAVGLLVAVLLGIALSATMLRRLERLRDAARRLDVEGLDAVPPPVDNSGDEIGELSRAFAGMQARLRRQEDARRAFVATASHELRTPLTSLDGMLELLADDLASEPPDLEDARERVRRAQQQSRRLASLASDLLDLSQLDSATSLRSEPVELGELARAVAAEFELRAEEEQLQLTVVPVATPCWGRGDPGRIAQILRILLDNALRVAPRGSAVDVNVGSGDGHPLLAVHDEGPGIPAEERELIFERFQRGSGQRPESGFGLGLAIGRELAERMDGELALATMNGHGATFELRLPGVPAGVEA
jgi:signal transduction histidine kinase